MLKKIFIFVVFFAFLVTSFFLILLYGISREIGQNINYIPSIIKNSIKHPSSVKNILILGLDKRDDWLEKTNTTDTIILVNINRGNINLISLPRDLWDWQLNQKINQIYPQSLNQSNQYSFIQENFSRLTGQEIDKTLVITTRNLSDLLKLIGGVDVYLEKGFKDDKYPNPEYILHPQTSIPVYTTVEFKSGFIHLDETNVTQFVRSRKSSEETQNGGTDIGRIIRQQLVFDALFKKLTNPSLYQNLTFLFNIYRFWYTQIQTNITDSDLFSIAYNNRSHLSRFQINKISIPSGENPKTDIIYHPKSFMNSQWVFIPQDKSYSTFRQFISNSLHEQK